MPAIWDMNRYAPKPPGTPNTPSFTDYYRYSQNATGDALNTVKNTENPFGDVSSLDDAIRKFGLTKDVSSVFNPAKANLSATLGTARANATSRAAMRGGNSATPGQTFNGIEGQYSEALGQGMGNIESQEGQAKLDQSNRLGSFLASILGQKGQFGLQKAGMEGNLAGQTFGLAQGYRKTEMEGEPPGFLAYLGAILGPAAKVATAGMGGAAAAGGI